MRLKQSLDDILLHISAVKNSHRSTSDKIRIISFLRKKLKKVVEHDQAK